jgi:hypothetical protein
MLESATGLASLICGGLCVLAVVAVVVIVALGGSAAALLPFGTYLGARFFRQEPQATATSYSLDQSREAGVDHTDSRTPPSQEE